MINKKTKHMVKAVHRPTFYVALLFVFIALATILVISFRDIRITFTEAELDRMSRDVGALSRSMRLRVELAKQGLRTLAADDYIVSSNTSECSAVATQYLAANTTVFNTLNRVNKEGRLDCSNIPSEIGKKLVGTDLPHIDTLYNDPSHTVVVSEVVIGSVNGESMPYMAIYVPIYKDGVFNGALGTALFLKDVGVMAFNASHIFSRANTMIVDSAKNIVYESTVPIAITKFDKSTTMSREAIEAMRRVFNGSEVRDVIPIGNNKYLISRTVDFAKNKSWIMFSEISQSDILTTIGSNRLGVLLLRASLFEHVFIAFLLSIGVTAMVFVVARGIRRIL